MNDSESICIVVGKTENEKKYKKGNCERYFTDSK